MSTEHGPDGPLDGPDAATATVAAEGAPSTARSRTGLLAPLVVLLVVAALAIAAMTGGSDDADPAPTAATDTDADAPGEQLPEDLATEEDDDLEAQVDEQADEQQLAAEEQRAALAALATRDPDDPRALGAADAPVVMIEWADFLCPFCGVFARDTEPELIARYVDTGLLRIEWRDLPFQGDQALLAALGGQAAAEQDAFWDYHEALFAEDLRRDQNRVDRAFLQGVAAEIGLDVDRFTADLDDPQLAERVRGEAAIAQELGISGTPAFIIGGYPLVGAQPIESFVQVIEVAAEDAGAELP